MEFGQIGRYQIKKEISRTEMSMVYRGYDPHMEREVAIKVVRGGSLDRFKQEIKIIAALKNPHVISVYDQGEFNGDAYFVMPYMKGGSLLDRLDEGPLSLKEAVRIIEEISPALDAVHKRNIIHRDLKPKNILFDEDGNAYIADFGIARLYETSTTRSYTTLIGSPDYMSPEQAKGEKDLDGRSDIYSFGAVIFYMLTGKPPYEAETPVALALKHIHEPIPQLIDFNPTLPLNLQSIINKSMAKDRNQRYQNATQLANDFKEKIRVKGTIPIPELPITHSRKPAPKWVLGAGSILLIGILLFIVNCFIPQPVIPCPALKIADSSPTTYDQTVTKTPEIFESKNATSLPTSTPLPSNTPLPPTDTNTLTPTQDPNKPPRNAKEGDTWISPVDGSTMVFVPEGEFLMGALDEAVNAYNNEKPQHTVYTDPFWMDQTEVTYEQFLKFLNLEIKTSKTTDRSGPNSEQSLTESDEFGIIASWNDPGDIESKIEYVGKRYIVQPEISDHPVAKVTWFQANEYCKLVGKRLPTEAEWEKAAKGWDDRTYPWGDEYITGKRANLCDRKCISGYQEKRVYDGYAQVAPVGSFPEGASPFGILDMAGNVWEWIADWYDPDYYQISPSTNPTGPESGTARVIRGGSWNDKDQSIHTTHRGFALPSNDLGTFGFRCVLSP